MSAPAPIGSIEPSAQTLLLSPAQSWLRARCCAKSSCKIAVYSAWDFPPLHAFGNEIDWARLDAGEKKARGSLLSRANSPGVGGRKTGNDLPDYQREFSRVRRRLVSDLCHSGE